MCDVYVYIHVGVYMPVCTCGGLRRISGVIFDFFFYHFNALRQGLPLTLELGMSG